MTVATTDTATAAKALLKRIVNEADTLPPAEIKSLAIAAAIMVDKTIALAVE